MAGKPLRFHPEAEQDFLASLEWYLERSPIAAVDFERAIARSLEAISSAPRRWPAYFEQFRKYTLHQFPFSIVYEELSSEIVVFAVSHGRRKPGYWKNRT